MQAEVALGVAAPDGGYREIAAGGYQRASVIGQYKRFGPASANWGIVGAVGVATDDGSCDWEALSAPLLVRTGDLVEYDAGAETLRLVPSPPVTDTAPTLTARPHATILRGGKA